MRPLGPWIKKLMFEFLAKEAIPDGGSFVDGLKFLSSSEAIKRGVRNATALTFEAVDAVRAAPDCKWRSDEEIAEQIYTKIKEAKNENRRA